MKKSGFYLTDNPSVSLAEDTGFLFAGRKAVLHCNAEGWPLPTVKWLVKGKQLRDGDLNQTISLTEEKLREQISLSLHFSNVKVLHAGNYTCEARNKYREKRRNIQVSISCKRPLLQLLPLT